MESFTGGPYVIFTGVRHMRVEPKRAVRRETQCLFINAFSECCVPAAGQMAAGLGQANFKSRTLPQIVQQPLPFTTLLHLFVSKDGNVIDAFI